MGQKIFILSTFLRAALQLALPSERDETQHQFYGPPAPWSLSQSSISLPKFLSASIHRLLLCFCQAASESESSRLHSVFPLQFGPPLCQTGSGEPASQQLHDWRPGPPEGDR